MKYQKSVHCLPCPTSLSLFLSFCLSLSVCLSVSHMWFMYTHTTHAWWHQETPFGSQFFPSTVCSETQVVKPLDTLWWFEYAWPTGSGTIRRCGLVGGSASLWGWALRPPCSCLEAVCSWLPSDKDLEFSAPPAPCLPAHCHTSCHDANGLNLRSCKSAPMKYCPL